jgi:hypothetical protein
MEIGFFVWRAGAYGNAGVARNARGFVALIGRGHFVAAFLGY